MFPRGLRATEEFRFWNTLPLIEAPVVQQRCFQKTSTTQLKPTIPSRGNERDSSISTTWKSKIPKDEIGAATEKYIDITISDNDELRQSLINRCEDIVLGIVKQLCAGQLPMMSYKMSTIETLIDQSESPESLSTHYDFTTRAGVAASSVFETPESMDTDSIVAETEVSIEESSRRKRIVDFGCERSRNKFALMITTMAKIHELRCSDRTETRRSFFYELKGDDNASTIVTKQQQVDRIVNILANLLECPPWDTGLVASAKGLAVGNMTLGLSNDSEINFTNPGGTLIPPVVSNVAAIRAKAKFVIVVEKDTVFQKLLDEDCPNRLDCILITGKGFPDIATRMLVNILAERMELPVYALVDADPYGFEIMCTYKYGSIKLSHEQGTLACPSIRWLGLHPSDLTSFFDIPSIPLTNADVSKIDSLLTRPYVDERLLAELKIMRRGKAEIEAIICSSASYSYSFYLQTKIGMGDYI